MTELDEAKEWQKAVQESPLTIPAAQRNAAAIIAALERAERLEAAMRRSEAMCARARACGSVLRAALAPMPDDAHLRGIGTNEDGDAIAVYEDGSRVNLEDPGLAPTPATQDAEYRCSCGHTTAEHAEDRCFRCNRCSCENFEPAVPGLATTPSEEGRKLIVGDRPLSPRGRTVDPFEESADG